MKTVTVTTFTVLLISAVVLSAPTYSDYENARELYDLLVQRELLDSITNPLVEAAAAQHRMVRKNQRSPSLRLRFGRRSDPALYQNAFSEENHNDAEVN
ncbi:short neuropeptide F-like [Daktulosphaira vitifoliae]|uniref:short neuropeptide F-like n=1 Tax=Daktulosphaira vitifoliae TaxID=58002 RepID=UPI0021AB0989|nr:short neuropeptide F-like [Daktulosphaira vitifoliae]